MARQKPLNKFLLVLEPGRMILEAVGAQRPEHEVITSCDTNETSTGPGL